LESIVGGVRVAQDIQAQATVMTRKADLAKEAVQEFKDGLEEAGKELAALAEVSKGLAPLVPLLRKVEVTQAGKAVRIKSQVPADVLEQILKSLAKPE
jgi:hypothetical protein